MQRKALTHDKDGDAHYDVISAFQKSIRGSDVDAALHYLGRLVEAGDLPIICRRLMVIATRISVLGILRPPLDGHRCSSRRKARVSRS